MLSIGMQKPCALTLAATLVLAGLAGCGERQASAPAAYYWPTDGWRTAAPEEQGFDSAKLAEAIATIRAEDIRVHSLAIVRNESLILDAYFYPYDGGTVHELASVTKSVMTTLIGIAADQGRLSLDDTMVSFFPGRSLAHPSPWKDGVTVRHLATMTSGLDCVAAGDERTLHEMEDYPDWVQFTLDLEVISEPGSRFEYCSPGMHVLSAILHQATGMTAQAFAQQYLFGPLGIEEVLWDIDPRGDNDGWAGLYLHPHDVAKLGLLWLQGGQWEGEQLVSREWVEQSVRRQVTTGMGDDYGYGWWIMPGEQGEYAAEGRSGQYIRVFLTFNALVVTTGGGFDWNEIAPLIGAALVYPEGPIDPVPAASAELARALARAVEPPAVVPAPELPPIAAAISDETFAFTPNPLDMRTLELRFDGTDEARLALSFTNQPDQDFLIGLDGRYRLNAAGEDYGLPMGMRGRWIEADTFLLEYDRIANRDSYTLELKFLGDRLTIDMQERTESGMVHLEGSAQPR